MDAPNSPVPPPPSSPEIALPPIQPVPVPLHPNRVEVLAQPGPRRGQELLAGYPGHPPLSGPGFRAVLQSFQRHWPLATASSVAAGAVVAAAVWFLLPLPKLTAVAVVNIASTAPTILNQTLEARTDFMTYCQSQATMVKSRLVLNAVLARPEVAGLGVVRAEPDPVSWLEKQVHVDFKLGPEFMRVSLEGDQADDMKQLLASVVDVYMREIVNKERIRRTTRLEHLKAILGRYEDALRSKRKTVRELAEAVGTGDAQVIALKQKFAQEQLAMAQKELLQVRSELRRTVVEARTARHQAAGTPPEVPEEMIQEALDRDPAALQHKDRITKLEAYVEQFRQAAVPGRELPGLTQARADLAQAKKDAESYAAAARPALIAQAGERLKQRRQAELFGLQNRQEICKELEKALSSEIDGLAEKTQALTHNQLDLESYRQEISQVEKTAERIAQEVESLRVELDAPSRVTLLEEPYVTQGTEGQRRMKYAGTSGGAMFVLVLCGVVWWDYRLRRVGAAEDVADGLGLRLLGTVPAPPGSRRRRRRGTDRDWQGLLSESMDAVRTSVLHGCQGESYRCVMITSAAGGEGKTTLATQLSGSLARAGYRTLLVDGDMRRPAVHRLLGVEPGPGLSELLRGEAEASAVITQTPVEHLSVIPAGRWTPAVSHLLARDAWRTLLDRLRGEFDFVIVDAPPVLPVVDTVLLGRHVDGVLVSVLRNVSQLGPVREAQHRLTVLGIRVIGSVVNGITVRTGRYGYTSADQNQGAGR